MLKLVPTPSDESSDPPPLPLHPRVGPPDPPARPSSFARLGMLGLTTVVGLVGVFLAARLDRLDTALLFVGIPCLTALVVALLPTTDGWATMFQITTVMLLLASALLHEGALCVMIAAPLVYGAVAAVYGTVRAADRHRGSYPVVLPLLALLALEGAVPGLRVNPEQRSHAERVVAAQCASFETALARGPRIDEEEDRGLLLRLAQYPTPVAADGTGLAEGDRWTLTMPAGALRTEVTGRQARRVTFDVVEDTARTTRWVDLHGGTLTWSQTDAGCVAEVSLGYTRKLDPSLWFGPVTDVFMDAGTHAFLASLD